MLLMHSLFLLLSCLLSLAVCQAQPADYTWATPSHNASESMPVGGCDMGMNVWTENGNVMFYLCRSGSFDENNTLLKAGKFVVRTTPGLDLRSKKFRQTLHLNDGYMTITDGRQTTTIWADVYKPVVHIEVTASTPVKATVEYVNWRDADRIMDKKEGQQCSYKWTVTKATPTRRDVVERGANAITFFHHNPQQTVFDGVVSQQGLDSLKHTLYNPIANLTFGGRLSGLDGKEKKRHHFTIVMADTQQGVEAWRQMIDQTASKIRLAEDKKASRKWWNGFWQRSYIHSDGEAATLTRNYTLFRYLLGCNAHSTWPTKFNGGLFTFDPAQVDSTYQYTPDFRRWGGGTHTAQNQRLVYWPMLATGDYDLMLSQFEFYRRILPTAEARTRAYWGHEGACFAEQIENFGLPNPAEYGSKRPASFDKGVEYNAWLEYEWDTALEFCQMILDAHRHSGMDITVYHPLILNTLKFFDEHYRYLARQRGRKELDGQGRLVIYPGSGCETYKMAYNPASTVAALRSVLTAYIAEVDSSADVKAMLSRVPDIPLRTIDGHEMIAPAITWERVNNVETPQLYPVFPWKQYGVGRPRIEQAINTYLYDPDAQKFRSSTGWKQDNIWAACLGLTDEAYRLTCEKLADGKHRFPAFWGPGYDWTPDHNWGGSGMLGLQYMLLQETDDKLLLFPAWPLDKDISFRLHAKGNTIVEADLRDGKVIRLSVTPKERLADVVMGGNQVEQEKK